MRNKVWGVLGKQQTYNVPKPLGEKIPLNSSPTESWDYKKSRYKRIDLYPVDRSVNFLQQQAGVPETTSSSPTPQPSPTPSPTPPVLLWNTYNVNWENANTNWETA